MAQFLRFVLLLFLALVGFGTGICGTLGVVMLAIEPQSRHDYGGVIVFIAAIMLAIAVACFFGVRFLIRRMNRHAVAAAGGTGGAPREATDAAPAAPSDVPPPPAGPPGPPPAT
jgi:phosphotransferase system  glucose/maltose/N-acetylglucosamine-specific IIC component